MTSIGIPQPKNKRSKGSREGDGMKFLYVRLEVRQVV